MKLPVLICDDSRLARRQMARSLPQGWDVELSFAENGAEAIDMIHQGKADLLFLDLNMPVMNGYEVLDQIRSDDPREEVRLIERLNHKRLRGLVGRLRITGLAAGDVRVRRGSGSCAYSR